MTEAQLSKFIPAIVLLVLGIIEAVGGLYLEDRRTRNDWTIEVISLITLPTLIQPGIYLCVIWLMHNFLPHLDDVFVDVGISTH